MEISFPRRKAAVVGGPDGLEGDRRRAAAGSGPELVGFEVPLFLENGIRNRDRRLRPERFPPGHVGFEVARERPFERLDHGLGRELRCDACLRRRAFLLRVDGTDAPDAGQDPGRRLLPFRGDLVAHSAPALLMVAGGRAVPDDFGGRITETGQGLPGQRILFCIARRDRRRIGRRDQPRHQGRRQAFEGEPAHGLGRVDEGRQPGPVFPFNPADGFGDGEPHGLDLSKGRNVELQGRGRDLGRGGVAVVGDVAHPVDGVVILFRDLLPDPGEAEFGRRELGHRTEVPEVGPVEGHPQRLALFPDEGPDHAVPQRDGLVPRPGQGLEDEVMAGRRERASAGWRRAGRDREQRGDKQDADGRGDR